MSAYELYAGGTSIGGAGRLPPEPESGYDHHMTLEIPASAIDANGRLVLAMRVWQDPEIGTEWESGPYLGRFVLGNVGDLRAGEVIRAVVPSMILAALYFVLGWYHLLIARRNPVLREFFWFGCFSIALGVYTLEFSQSKFFLDIPFWLHKKLEFLSLYLLPILLTQTLFIVTRTPLNSLFRFFYFVFIILFAAIALIPTTQINLQTLKLFQYMAATWSICLAGIISWRAWQGVRSARIVFVLLLLLVAAVFNDVIMADPWLHSRQSLQYVGAFLLIFIALLMAERYTDVLKRLEVSVEERTAELVTMNRELEAAVETKNNFLATISHELRTPMNAILGLTHLGLKTELTNQQRDYFTKVEKSAEGLQDIINSILDFSRLEEGELEIVNAPFKPGTLADDIEHAWRSVAQNAGLQMNITVDPGLPAALSGDRARLKQVLGNFLSNAIKFTKHGEVSLDIRLLQLQPDTATVRFAVSDTGMGISDEQREHLFDAFSQADNSMTRNFGGTGLGLAIAQQLVAKMGGDIALESSPGNGSTFSFALELPLSNIVAATAQETEPRSGEPVDLSPIQGARLLLVDDSDINLQVAGELLKQANLYVDVAHNGREAVDRVMSGNYECVLMDVQMPVMDGYTATETIRSDGRFEDLPILAMTANAMPQDRARGAQAGMNEYIPKPIEPDDLYRALLRWIPAGEREYKQPEDNAGVKNGPDSTELPETLPGIDIADGLKRVGGNAGLYRKLLQDMCQNYADVTSELQSLLDAERTEDARQLAHKLRGIANNLGASDVGTSAQAIELALKSDLAVEAQHISELADALRVVTGSQVSLVPLTGSAPMAGRFSDTELQGIFNEVLQGVDDNNPEALDIVTRLLSGIDEQGKGYAQTAAAHAALDMFAFASARNQLLELAEIRGWPIH